MGSRVEIDIEIKEIIPGSVQVGNLEPGDYWKSTCFHTVHLVSDGKTSLDSTRCVRLCDGQQTDFKNHVEVFKIIRPKFTGEVEIPRRANDATDCPGG